MNVILIIADQLSAKWLGCYGNKAAYTPNIDKMAAEGALFERCYSNHPVCMPARATIITGRSAVHHGVLYNGYELGTDIETYPEVLRRNNITTLGIGKFHLECHGRSAYNDVKKYGFDYAETTEDIRCGEWLDWVEETYPQYYEQALATVWEEPHLRCYSNKKINLLPKIRKAKEKYNFQEVAPMTGKSIIPEEVCQTSWITQRAIDLLKKHNHPQPFFLNISYVDPHDPYDPPERFLSLIDRNKIPSPIKSEDPLSRKLYDKFSLLPFVKRFKDCTDEDWISMRHYYFASLAFIDEQIGKLMTYLEESGLSDNTVIIFTSDHGDMLGNHGYPTKGAWHRDACIRVPLIIKGPGVVQGRRNNIVSLLDIFPTIIDYCNADSDVPVEGTSLKPLSENTLTKLNRPDACLIEIYGSYGNTDYDLHAVSLVTYDKIYTRMGDGSELIFNILNDPDETVNIAYGNNDTHNSISSLRKLAIEMIMRKNNPLPVKYKHPFAQH